MQIQSSTETEVLSLDLRKSKVTGKWGSTTTTDAKYDKARLSWKRQRSRCAEGGFKDGQPSQWMRLSERFADYLYGLLRSVHSKGSTSWVYLIVSPKRDAHQQIDSDLQSVLKSPSLKYCQRHNGPKGWVQHIKVTCLGHNKMSNTNLDQNLDEASTSKSQANISISTKP